MSRRRPTMGHIRLPGLHAMPSQVCGSIRLVPLLRDVVREDLRLARQRYVESLTVVSLADRTQYLSYVPHGMVMSWDDHDNPAAAFGGQLLRPDGVGPGNAPQSVRLTHRMARRVEPNRLRFLPLHLAMEGFLALHFGGPDIAWQEYTRRSVATGLTPRSESSRWGSEVEGLEDALRTFEIHDGQVGVLLFAADVLASAFVTPHPDDYRALHQTLLEDFFGELIHQYARVFDNSSHIAPALKDGEVNTLADLRSQLQEMREQWADFQFQMAEGLLGQPVISERVYQAGPFQLERFITSLKLTEENHIGEAIIRDDGTVEYLKTFRLSATQVKRTYLLRCLATNNWNLGATATEMKCSPEELIVRIDRAGFDYLLHEHVLKTARKRLRG